MAVALRTYKVYMKIEMQIEIRVATIFEPGQLLRHIHYFHPQKVEFILYAHTQTNKITFYFPFNFSRKMR